MKKVYLTLLVAFLGGIAFAQNTTITNGNNQENKIDPNATSISGGTATNSNQGNQTTTKEKTEQVPTVISSNPNKTQTIKPEVDLPGFPVYINTGDKETDKKTYLAAKEKWIKENQDLYNNYLKNQNKTDESK